LEESKHIRITDIEGYVLPSQPPIPVIVCNLENGKTFILYSVPYEIVIALSTITHEGEKIKNPTGRSSIFDLLSLLSSELENTIGRRIRKIVIDYLDPDLMVYGASVYIDVEGAVIVKKMIPSHALFLAQLFNVPMYVSEDLVFIQESMLRDEESEEF